MIIYMQTKNIYTKSFQFCYYRDLQVWQKMSQDLPSANQSFFRSPHPYSLCQVTSKYFAFSSSHRPHAFAHGLPSASSAISLPLFIYMTNSSFPSKLGHVSSTVTVTLSQLWLSSFTAFSCCCFGFHNFIYYIIVCLQLQFTPTD